MSINTNKTVASENGKNAKYKLCKITAILYVLFVYGKEAS